MNKFMNNRFAGFTMLELMIVIVIVALLLTLAFPSYVKYTRKANRGEAQQLLMNWAVNQEIWRSNHALYADDVASPNGLPVPTSDYYNFSLGDPNPPTAAEYFLQAAAQGDQAKDEAKDGTPCATLTLNQNGAKGPPACWD
jgi:type IV pilus assembly protein PilE